jgi:3'(2'), 5'-bisphosphate nucleotidase
VRDRAPVLGVVALPASGELFGGLVGVGAWKQDRAGRRPIRTRPAPPEGLHVLASRHHAGDPRLAAYLAGKKIASVTHVGAAVKFCRLAEGEADLYPRFGRTMEWDTAGPQAVLEAAGGHTRLMNGGPLRYAKPGWANPPFVCTGT